MSKTATTKAAKPAKAAAAKSTSAADAKAKAADAGVNLSDEEKAALVAPPEGARESGSLRPSGEERHSEPQGPELETVRVIIRANEMTGVPRRVFSHEVAILQTLHGEENVQLVEGTELDLPIQSDVDAEYERLLRVYGRKGAKAVNAVYPSAALLADDLGLRRPSRSKATKQGLELKQQSSQRGAGVQ